MNEDIIVIVAEDDDGHATLIQKNLKRAGIMNDMLRFRNGEEVLDFLYDRKEEKRNPELYYLLLLDIRMPRVDGIEVLRQLKGDERLKSLPVIMLTTTDDPVEINKCHQLGCNSYVVKPLNYESFIEVINRLGLFMKIVKIPNQLNEGF
ncbi:response regulator [Aquibacillus halophilus]|uniref:Response regulator n=1 Tax=Aquibacillus halophilus TaxID=930132 RepID=A0A6A8DJK8_9BACI|nr:response regulator [Aquibacillus halophilus]MRH41512.1 response regulator [Aquibacillus halophilus]